jgi:hypothetical protein
MVVCVYACVLVCACVCVCARARGVGGCALNTDIKISRS